MAVAETNSFSRAAERLFVSQPSVSQQISQYEAELGFPLFVRTTRTVALTSQGKLLYKTLKELMEKWDAAVSAARLIDPCLHGSLRVGMLYGWSIHRLPTQALNQFQKKYPSVEFILEKNNYTEMTECLRSGESDVILTIEDEIVSYPDICYKPAYQDRTVMLIGADHPLADSEPVLRHLDGLKIYLLGEKSSRSTIEIIRRVVGPDMRFISCPNFESILLALDQGKGCTFTALSSSACENSSYRYYDTGYPMNIIACWLKDNTNPALPYLLAEF